MATLFASSVRHLPRVDAVMMTAFFGNNPDFISAEIKGAKTMRSTRESYGDNAIGYVQVKPEGDICIVKAKITPEHRIHTKTYSVVFTCNESDGVIKNEVKCEDCTAHLGGCKHAVAFIAWLH